MTSVISQHIQNSNNSPTSRPKFVKDIFNREEKEDLKLTLEEPLSINVLMPGHSQWQAI